MASQCLFCGEREPRDEDSIVCIECFEPIGSNQPSETYEFDMFNVNIDPIVFDTISSKRVTVRGELVSAPPLHFSRSESLEWATTQTPVVQESWFESGSFETVTRTCTNCHEITELYINPSEHTYQLGCPNCDTTLIYQV